MKRITTFLSLLLLALPLSAQEQGGRPLIAFNRTVLSRVKHQIQRGEAAPLSAYRQLIREADGLLSEGPFTVTTKTQTPPSGDKHDYVSQGPYWWPDPSKPDGLPYIRRDGEVYPGYYDYPDRDQLEKLTDAVRKLGLAYYFSGEEKYAAHAARLLRAWFLDPETRMNPNLNYGQRIPGICEGRGIGLIDTRTFVEMLDGAILVSDSKAWSEADERGLKAWFSEFRDWMLHSPIGQDEGKQHNNHGTYYDLQVVAYSIFIGQSGFARNHLREVTRRRLDSQLAPDGEQPFEMARTKPWGYCGMNLQGFVDLAQVGEKVGENLWVYRTPGGASIRKAIEWYFPFWNGEKPWPKEEITGHRHSDALVAVLMKGSRYDKAGYAKQLEKLLAFTGDGYDLQTSLLQLTYPIFEGPVTDDPMFFDALDLDYPGLEAVKEDVARGDYDAAKRDFVRHLKTRQEPQWLFDWRDVRNPAHRDAAYDRGPADKIASNLLESCSIPHQFGDTIDWSINPAPLEYVEWTYQLSRHPFWVTLGQAYQAIGDEKYARAFVRQMRSWVMSNPLPDTDANVNWSRWRTIETGIRTARAWPESFFYFLGSPSFDDESIVMMVKSFHEHGLHLRSYHRQNNWLTMEMNGLFHTGILFPEFKESREWCEYASRRLYEEQQKQFYPDGAQVELAPGYHGVSLHNILGIYDVARINHYPLPEDFIGRMESAYNYYLKICMPDGSMPALNDAGWGDARRMLAQGFSYLPGRTDFQYVATGGKQGTVPAFTSVWMPWAGWYVSRSGWDGDALYAHFEVGPFSPAHSHEDKLSFLLSAYGRRLLTECGTYAYDTSQWRAYALSARGHNVSRVDGKDQNRRSLNRLESIRYNQAPMPNRWISNERFDFAEGWYDEGFGRDQDSTVTQYRALVFVKDRYWLLFDVFTPSDPAQHDYCSWFHLNSGRYRTEKALHAVGTDDAGEANLTVVPLWEPVQEPDVVCGQETPEVQGWAHLQGYECIPVATPVFRREGSGTCVMPYLFYPTRAGDTLPVRSVKIQKDGDIKVLYRDGSSDRIRYRIGNGCLEGLSLTTRQAGKRTTIPIL
ncbi:MAG: alginate lyase family protein [Bacteroidales bacterium]|nr:alginate lyase family protein [Bacteroidales bacterium]